MTNDPFEHTAPLAYALCLFPDTITEKDPILWPLGPFFWFTICTHK